MNLLRRFARALKETLYWASDRPYLDLLQRMPTEEEHQRDIEKEWEAEQAMDKWAAQFQKGVGVIVDGKIGHIVDLANGRALCEFKTHQEWIPLSELTTFSIMGSGD